MLHYGILDVSLYQIQLFLAVAEKRNFSRAADTMHISQPALSKRIKTFENTIGIELFDRSKRPLELTPAGTMLYNQLKPLETKIEAGLFSIHKEYNKNITRLSVGLPDSGKELSFFHKAGKFLQSETTGVSFSWQYLPIAKWREMLNNGSFDIMMMLRMEESTFEEGWQWERIMEVPKLVCMLKTNPLSEKEAITYEDLRTQRFVMNPLSTFPTYYHFVREQTLKHGGFEPEVARFAPDPHNLIANLQYDDEVVVCDMYLKDVGSDFIKSFELPDTKSGLDAIWRKDNKNPFIRPYLELSRKFLEEMYPGTVCER